MSSFLILRKLLIALILILLMMSPCFNQSTQDKITGTWVNKNNSTIILKDDGRAIIDIGRSLRGCAYLQLDDTLRLIREYKHKAIGGEWTEGRDIYDLLISLSDTALAIQPFNLLAKREFGFSSVRSYTRHEYFVDSEIKFKRIIFHFGGYSLEIDSSRTVYLQKLYRRIDTSDDLDRIDRFQDQLSVAVYDELLRLLSISNLRYMRFRNVSVSHVPFRTFIIYFNDKKLKLRSQVVPYLFLPLTDFLLDICRNSNFSRTNIAHDFER